MHLAPAETPNGAWTQTPIWGFLCPVLSFFFLSTIFWLVYRVYTVFVKTNK